VTHALRGRTAIVGIGEAAIPLMPPGSTPIDAMALAAMAALADAGLTLTEVDGVFAAGLQVFMPTLSLAEYLGLRPRYSDGTQIGGGAFLTHLNHAQAAIHAGLCDIALIVYGSTQRSAGNRFASHAEPNPYEQPYRVPGPVAAYALIAGRHMHEFGTTPEQLAEIAVAARQWARLTPGAVTQGPLTIADVLAARRIAEPFGLLDCCLVTDGAGAVVVTASDRARDLQRDPVYVLGAGEAVSHRGIAQMPDLTTTAARESGARAFAAAGLAPADIDVLQLYDAFTINPILFLEDLGFCAKGEGGAFVAGGALAPGGRLPVNTNGGGLSYCHPGMYGIFTIIESVRQLRGGLGARQVANAELALAHAPGGYMSSQSTAIFGTAATL